MTVVARCRVRLCSRWSSRAARSLPASAYLKLGTMINGRTRDCAMGDAADPVFRERRGSSRRQRRRIPRGGFAGPFGLAGRVQRRRSASSSPASPSAEPLDDDGMSTMGFRARARSGSDAGGDGISRRYDDGRDSRVGRFLQLVVPLVGGVGWNARPLRPAIDRDARGRPLRRSRSLGARRNRAVEAGNRRLIAAGAVMFPIAFSAGDISGRTLRPDDRRRRLGHLSGRHVSRRRPGRSRARSPRTVRAFLARTSSRSTWPPATSLRASASTPRADSSSPAWFPAPTSSASSRSTTVT